MKMISILLAVVVAFGICPIAAAEDGVRAGYVERQETLRDLIQKRVREHNQFMQQSRDQVILLEGAIQEWDRQKLEEDSARIAEEFLAAEALAEEAAPEIVADPETE